MSTKTGCKHKISVHLATNLSFQAAFDAVGQLIEKTKNSLSVSESIFQDKLNGAI
jgi:hypothetical protein